MKQEEEGGEEAKLGERAGEDSRRYDQLPPAVPVRVQMLRLTRPVTSW